MVLKKKHFNIVILEDNEFYNSLFTKLIQYYAETLSIEKDCSFEVGSYLSPKDFLKNLKKETNLVFLDYYLGNGFTAPEVMREIKKKCTNCKIVILSKTQNSVTEMETIANGALEFIYKDDGTLPKSCSIVDDLVNNQL